MNETTATNWTLAEKLTFRLVFIYFLLFILFFTNGGLPVVGFIGRGFSENIVRFMSSSVLGMNYIPSRGFGGSGDTTYHYILLLFVTVTSIGGCILWSYLDRVKDNYNKLLYWLTVIIRFYVGIIFIHYGIVKLIKTQFAHPDLMRLLTTYGDSSPMGLAWTFLGFSDGYNIFMGIAEVSCVLLFFRRTVVLGAIIALMVSANVMAINYFFDVPVKILSTALVVMSIFLLIPNFYRLIDIFIKGKAASLKNVEAPVIKKKWLWYSKTAFKYVFIMICILPTVYSTLSRRHLYGDAAPKLPLYGVYTVESFDAEVPLPKWDKLVIQRQNYSAIKMANNNTEYCNMNVDTIKRQLEITFKNDLTTVHKFNYRISVLNHLELNGIYFGKPLTVTLIRQPFELTERSFNWINEVPYNR